MTPTQFYSLPVLFSTTDLTWLFNYDAFPELGFPTVPNPNSMRSLQLQRKVEFKIVKFETLKKGTIYEREIWRLGSIWFEGVPCMILRNPDPNESSHYPLRFVTDEDTHKKMTRYLASQTQKEDLGDTSNEVNRLFAEMSASSQPVLLEIPYPSLSNVEAAIDELLKVTV